METETPLPTPQENPQRRARIIFWWNIAVITFLLLLLTPKIYRGYLNYQGICLDTGRHLPAQERIDIAAQQILAHEAADIQYQKSEYFREFKRALEEEGRTYNEPVHIIPYKDLEEFYALNPQCCRLALREPENYYHPAFEQRLWGRSRWLVLVDYRTRYHDDNEIFQEKMHKNVFLSSLIVESLKMTYKFIKG